MDFLKIVDAESKSVSQSESESEELAMRFCARLRGPRAPPHAIARITAAIEGLSPPSSIPLSLAKALTRSSSTADSSPLLADSSPLLADSLLLLADSSLLLADSSLLLADSSLRCDARTGGALRLTPVRRGTTTAPVASHSEHSGKKSLASACFRSNSSEPHS
jgi:hypothetical protein